MTFRMHIVGGPWDGVPGFSWRATRECPLPERIRVGRCPGRRLCGHVACVASRPHPAFWTEDEEMPVATVEYELESVEDPAEDGVPGLAVYAIGGLELPGPLVVEESVESDKAAIVAQMEQLEHEMRLELSDDELARLHVQVDQLAEAWERFKERVANGEAGI